MIYKIKKEEKKRTLKIIFGLEIDFAFRNDFAWNSENIAKSESNIF